jgi:hypothetical protein
VKGDVVILPFPFSDLSGSLPVDSFVRPNKIFTAGKNIILSVRGRLSDTKITEVINSLVNIVVGGE